MHESQSRYGLETDGDVRCLEADEWLVIGHSYLWGPSVETCVSARLAACRCSTWCAMPQSKLVALGGRQKAEELPRPGTSTWHGNATAIRTGNNFHSSTALVPPKELLSGQGIHLPIAFPTSPETTSPRNTQLDCRLDALQNL